MINEKEEMPLTALEIAAQCWCDDETSGIVMDERLAFAFSKRIAALQKRLAMMEEATGWSELEVEEYLRLREVANGAVPLCGCIACVKLREALK